MIQNNAEIIANNKVESVDMKDLFSVAREERDTVEQGANEAEEINRSLELELMEAQNARERKEEAERKGKETKEKISEMAG